MRDHRDCVVVANATYLCAPSLHGRKDPSNGVKRSDHQRLAQVEEEVVAEVEPPEDNKVFFFLIP